MTPGTFRHTESGDVLTRGRFDWSPYDWSLTWDAVSSERTGSFGDASSKHSWVTGWFQAEVLEMEKFHWLLTSAGLLDAKRGELSLADGPGGVAGSATRDAEFSLADEAGCFFPRRRGRKHLGGLRRTSEGGVFSEYAGAGEVRSSWQRVAGSMGS